MSASEERPAIAPYSRANLIALLTRVSTGEISDEEFYNGIDDIIISWKAQFMQPESPWGRSAGSLNNPHSLQK